MKTVPALFLVHDGDVEHGIFCLRRFASVYKNCNVEFIVPFTHRQTRVRYEDALKGFQVRFVECDPSLGTTLTAMFEASRGSEWVLWLTSDRYPIAHRDDGTLETVFELAATDRIKTYCAVKFCQWRELESTEAKDVGADCPPALAEKFEERPFSQFGFWQPILIRRSVLEKVLSTASDADHPNGFNKAAVEVLTNLDRPTLFPKNSLIKVEESLHRGAVTLNYEARRLRTGLTPTAEEKRGNITCSFNSPVAQRLNRHWRSASISPRTVLEFGFPKAPFHVVSFGGSGSKVLAKGIFASLPEKPKERVKNLHSHRRIPPIAVPSGMHTVYIYSDPRDAVISFFKRRERRHAAHGFAPGKNLEKPSPGWVKSHLVNLEADAGPLIEDWDMSRFLDNANDLFRLEEHFDNWFYSEAGYRIIFVRYETLWDNVGALASLIGVPEIVLPDQLERTANWQSEEADNRKALNAIYGTFAERLETLPDVFYSETGKLFDAQAMPFKLSKI